MISLINKIIKFPRILKQCIIFILEFFILNISTWLAFSIRFEEFHQITSNSFYLYLSTSFLVLFLFYYNSLYSSFFRYIDKSSVISVIKIFLIYSLCGSMLLFLLFDNLKIPRSIILLQSIFACCLILAERTIISNLVLHISEDMHKLKRNHKNILIYGISDLSFKVIQFLNLDKTYHIIGVISEEPIIKKFSSYKVFPKKNIKELAKKNKIDEIYIFSENLEKNKLFLEEMLTYNIKIKKINNPEQLLSSPQNLNIANLEIEDLLERSETSSIPSLMKKNITNKIILITGAAGSIGSEISRKILQLKPSRVFFLDNNEYEMYFFQKNLNFLSNIDIQYVLADISDKIFLKSFFEKNKIDTVFHAAAYKHVPLLEENIYASIKNNIIGTFNICFFSQYAKVKNFVFISTDKAIRPSSVMGASKKVAEQIVLNIKNTINFENRECIFSIVRFGNVLGSRGSILPLFKKQIEEGGPLTITDFNMKRYFMTIPEAAELVIQSGSLSQNDDVFLLDMGREVKIINLAKKMIALKGLSVKSNLNPSGDIEIKEIGIRPGEKLSEELNLSGKFNKTLHPKIFRSTEENIKMDVNVAVENFESMLSKQDLVSAKNYLKELSFLLS
jgi:FlaA1/EpsC-like NDP-sugar epimerase